MNSLKFSTSIGAKNVEPIEAFSDIDILYFPISVDF